MEDNSTIKTPDLYFASYLRVKGCKIVSIKREHLKRIFTFDVSSSNLSAADLRYGYFNNDKGAKFSAGALGYSDSIRSMKTLCHVEIIDQDIITPDLYFAAFLKSMNCSLKDIRKNPYKTIFVFDAVPSNIPAQDLQFSYFNGDQGQYNVSVLDYNDCIRDLKGMCQSN